MSTRTSLKEILITYIAKIQYSQYGMWIYVALLIDELLQERNPTIWSLLCGVNSLYPSSQAHFCFAKISPPDKSTPNVCFFSQITNLIILIKYLYLSSLFRIMIYTRQQMLVPWVHKSQQG